MYPVFKSNLGRRIFLLVIVSTALVLIGLTVSGWLAAHQSSERVFQEREALARSTATYLEYIVTQTLARLDGVAFSSALNANVSDAQTAERELHDIHISSVLDGVFVTDSSGRVLWAEPSGGLVGTSFAAFPTIEQSLTEKRPTVSDVLKIGTAQVQAVLMLSPFRGQDGAVTGLVGGWIEPADQGLRQVAQSVQASATSYTDVVDNHGIVIASSSPARVLANAKSLAGSGAEVIRSASLVTAPRAISLRHPKLKYPLH